MPILVLISLNIALLAYFGSMSNFKKSIAFSIIDVLEELLKPVTWPYHGNPTIVRNYVGN